MHLSAKKHIITCFSNKRLLLYTAIVTATIFVYKWTEYFRYCSAVQWSKVYIGHEKIDVKIKIAIFLQIESKSIETKKSESWPLTTLVVSSEISALEIKFHALRISNIKTSLLNWTVHGEVGDLTVVCKCLDDGTWKSGTENQRSMIQLITQNQTSLQTST